MALGFVTRLKDGLARSSQRLSGGISAVFTKRKLDSEQAVDQQTAAAQTGTPAAAAPPTGELF